MEGRSHCALCAMAFVSTASLGAVQTRSWNRNPFRRRPRYARVGGRGALQVPLRSSMSSSSSSGRGSDEQNGDGGGKHDSPLDMEALRRRINDVKSGKRSTENDLGHEVIDMSRMDGEASSTMSAHEQNQIERFSSVHALWVIVFKSSSDEEEGVYSLSLGDDNIILAFEEQQEATRYSLVLELQDFPSAQICQLDSKELREFCQKCGYRLGFVPRGALVTPPEESAIEDMDKWRGEGNDKGASGLSPDEVDTMKRRLENLFGQ